MNTPLNVDFYSHLIEFNFWENRRVWDEAIMPLTDEQFTTDTGYSWGTIQRECVHIMFGEWGWLKRIQGVAKPENLEFADYIDRAVIRQRWDEIQYEWEQYAAALTSETFLADVQIHYRGKVVDIATWKLLFHVVNHSNTHRAEVLRMVADVHEPAEFDLSMVQYFTGVFRD